MNVGLLFVALLVIIAGAASGSVFAVLFGVILLVPAVLPSRRRGRTPSRQPSQPPRPPPARVTPPPIERAKGPEMPVPLPQSPPPTSQSYASAPLFPTTIFPSLSVVQPAKHEAPAEMRKPDGQDEFLALVALVGIIRLLSGRR